DRAVEEGVGAVVGRQEGVIQREHGVSIVTGEFRRAEVARRRVVVGVLGSDGQIEGRARRGAGRSAHAEGDRGGRVHRDGAGRPGNGRGGRVVDAHRLRTGGLERHRVGEDVGAVIAADEGVVSRQDGRNVGAAEVDLTGVAGHGVVERVLGGYGQAQGRARGRADGRAGDGEVMQGAGVHRDGRLRAVEVERPGRTSRVIERTRRPRRRPGRGRARRETDGYVPRGRTDAV